MEPMPLKIGGSGEEENVWGSLWALTLERGRKTLKIDWGKNVSAV